MATSSPNPRASKNPLLGGLRLVEGFRAKLGAALRGRVLATRPPRVPRPASPHRTARRLSPAVAAALLLAAGIAPIAGGAPTAESPYWGLNLSVQNVPIFANMLRQAGAYIGTPNQPFALDGYGCPTTDFALEFYLIEAQRTATDAFPLRFPGQAEIVTYGTATVTNQAWDPVANVTTATVAVPQSAGQITLEFTQTRRLAADTTSTGIDTRQMTMMLPLTPGGTDYHDPGETFNRQLLAACAPWRGPRGYIRGLDLTNVNGVLNFPVQTPANRTMPFNPDQICVDANATTRGMSLELCIALANFLGCGLWLNFPDTGTPELFQLWCNVIKFGSDATGTPYTAAGGSNPVPSTGPVYAPLAGIFLWEESNEIWNGSFIAFENGVYDGQNPRYAARGKANAATLNANGEVSGPGGSTPLNLMWCQVAADLITHADIARATFPGGLNSKYFPIFSCQAGGGASYLDAMSWATRHLAARGETLAQNLAAMGGARYEDPYVDPTDPTQTVASVLAGNFGKQPGLATDGPVAAGYGLAYASYEGGPDAGNTATPLVVQVNHAPGMRAVVRDRMLNAVACRCRFITAYSLIRYEWSLVDSIHEPEHPKRLGHADAIAYYPCDDQSIPAVAPVVVPNFADPSFEQVQLDGVASGFEYTPSGSAWTFSNGAAINRAVGGAVAGNPIPEGIQTASFQGTAAISQAVAGWGAGSYQITGWFCGCTLNGLGPNPLAIQVDGVTVATLTPISQQFFQQFAVPVTPGPGTHTVAFSTSGSSNQITLLDGLAIVPVTTVTPTPSPSPAPAVTIDPLRLILARLLARGQPGRN